MLSKIQRFKHVFAVAALGIAVSLVAVDFAEARRGGSSFGSRGSRTYSAPATTNTAPGAASGINRSMTPNTQQNAASPANGMGAQAAQQQRRPGMFGGMAGGLLGGLALGGLFGMLMGNGFGGMAGFFGMLLQIALIAGLAMLALRFFARRQQPAGPAGGYGAQRNSHDAPRGGYGGGQAGGNGGGQSGFRIPTMGSAAGAATGYAGATAAPRKAGADTDEIGITDRDLNHFEKLLQDVQSAYGAEDYARLRTLTTPEAMSYLAEELGENATAGVKNDVRDIQLLQGDLSEAWRENGLEYATVAMRYSSIDVMRDRNSGAVVQGDEHQPSETVEVWTFVRKPAGEWQLSAIQGA
ncbi:Tim44 domain-containing protein [Neorhizobium sp. NPDC001467]|uniref:Tim44 domain-containing protein n=1 Tax=Neorhizobium sp. NPDC001467 TaxID=3390595 RepID=UPI003CFFD85C